MRFNIPPASRAFVFLTCLFTILYAIARWNTTATADRSIAYLTLVPAKVLRNPWTILTSTFVEQNVLNLLINTTAILLSGRYLERAWGTKDFAIVVFIAAIIPNLLVIPTYWIWGLVMRNTTRADTPIAGAITLQAAFLVSFKQLVPEHTVSLYKGLVKTRVKHFPFIFLMINTAGGLIFGTDTALLLAWYGLLTTWVYLRFFKYQQDLGVGSGPKLKGDASETFAFATFFPNIIQPPVAAICDKLYALLCRTNIISPFSDEAIASGNEQAAARGEGGLPIAMSQSRAAKPMSKREEAERRRQLALKALDERLNAASSQASTTGATAPVTTSNEHEQSQN